MSLLSKTHVKQISKIDNIKKGFEQWKQTLPLELYQYFIDSLNLSLIHINDEYENNMHTFKLINKIINIMEK